jgi:hypothetical protein
MRELHLTEEHCLFLQTHSGRERVVRGLQLHRARRKNRKRNVARVGNMVIYIDRSTEETFCGSVTSRAFLCCRRSAVGPEPIARGVVGPI